MSLASRSAPVTIRACYPSRSTPRPGRPGGPRPDGPGGPGAGGSTRRRPPVGTVGGRRGTRPPHGTQCTEMDDGRFVAFRFRAPCFGTQEPAGQLAPGGTSNGADRSRSEAERAERARPREEASGRSDVRSDDTRAWFERRLHEPSFVIPEISDFRRQRADASTAAGRARRGRASRAREASRRSEREE